MLPPPAAGPSTTETDADVSPTTAPAQVMTGIQALGDVVQVSGQTERGDIVGKQTKVKILGAEVPLAALIVSVLGVGGAAVGIGMSATAGSDSATYSTTNSASTGRTVSLALDRCVEVNDNLDMTVVRASSDSPGNSDPNGVCYVWFTPPAGCASFYTAGQAIAIGGNLKYAVPAPDVGHATPTWNPPLSTLQPPSSRIPLPNSVSTSAESRHS